MVKTRTSPDDILARLITQAVRHGADELEISYNNGCEEVDAIKNGVGIGIASLDSTSEEASALREQLYAIGKKGKTINAGGAIFLVQVSIFDSFGEDAYRVKIQARPNQ